MPLPFDGAISRYFHEAAPGEVRAAIAATGDDPILGPRYPYDRQMPRRAYSREMRALQLELAKLQADVAATGQRVIVLFEGRDAAGKTGAIRSLTANMSPRVARVVALAKPSDRERTEWYFQRYVARLPAAGEIVLFDRSWYNRAVLEHVFGFCTPLERQHFFQQLPEFEAMLVDEGIRLTKLWLTVGRAEQLRRFLVREADPLKQWKLSRIDVDSMDRWDAFTAAIDEMFGRTHTPHAPWTLILADDKRRARLAVVRSILAPIAYEGKDVLIAAPPDAAISGGPALWHG